MAAGGEVAERVGRVAVQRRVGEVVGGAGGEDVLGRAAQGALRGAHAGGSGRIRGGTRREQQDRRGSRNVEPADQVGAACSVAAHLLDAAAGRSARPARRRSRAAGRSRRVARRAARWRGRRRPAAALHGCRAALVERAVDRARRVACGRGDRAPGVLDAAADRRSARRSRRATLTPSHANRISSRTTSRSPAKVRARRTATRDRGACRRLTHKDKGRASRPSLSLFVPRSVLRKLA